MSKVDIRIYYIGGRMDIIYKHIDLRPEGNVFVPTINMDRKTHRRIQVLHKYDKGGQNGNTFFAYLIFNV